MGHRMTQRFFKAAPAVYAAVLAELDAAWGFPKYGCEHVFLPVTYAPQMNGMAYLAIRSSEADMEPADSMLPEMLEAGQVVEVTDEEYGAAMANGL